MSTYLDDLTAKRDEAADFMRTIVEGAEEDGRRLTHGEERELEARDAIFTRYDNEIRRLRGLEERIGPQGRNLARRVHSDDEGRSMYQNFNSGSDIRATLDFLRRAADGEPGKFDTSLSQGWYGRALQSAGGSAFTSTMADLIFSYERTAEPIWQIGRVLGVSSGAPLIVPRVTADSITAGTTTAEAAGITLGDPTISQYTLTPVKRAGMTHFSNELLQDNVIGIEGLVAEHLARPITLAFGSAFAATLGTAAGNGGTAAGTAGGASSWSFFGPPDLYTLFYSLASPYRSTGSWLVSTDAMSKIASFRDSNNQFILQPGFGGEPARILGRPIYESPSLSAVGSASKSVYFGSFDRFVIARVDPLRVEYSNDARWTTDEVSCRVVLRADGGLVDQAAVKFLISANV